ncbi:unnamed protein product [Cochlearia groenlandica]
MYGKVITLIAQKRSFGVSDARTDCKSVISGDGKSAASRRRTDDGPANTGDDKWHLLRRVVFTRVSSCGACGRVRRRLHQIFPPPASSRRPGSDGCLIFTK